ncbi:hypothetical protein CHS0354_028713 [Potamilus streckersoni]|uniref:F-box domain-containing protein n=1 Tax=Potamilus streckersoni TaxID=2493646 RepID=A0AAE0SZ24_9BIVA|nr:hypothetical protein CHS0354_028713 [Potamilus streckersoni]
MGVPIIHFPREVQAYILSKLDGVSSAFAKRVCRTWYEIISELERGLHYWFCRCVKEISRYSLVEITQLAQLSRQREITLVEYSQEWTVNKCKILPWSFWREVYAEFYRCQFIRTGEEKRTQLCYFFLHGEVTALHFQDNMIFSGHASGSVICWKNLESQMECDVIIKHQRPVTSITGLNMYDNVDDILCGKHLNMIISASIDSKLICHHLVTDNKDDDEEEEEEEKEDNIEIQHFIKRVNVVRSWGSCFIAAANGSLVQGQPIWNVDSEQGRPTQYIVRHLFGQTASNMTAVAFWDNTVLSGDEMGNVFKWSGNVLDKENKYTAEDMIFLNNFRSPVKKLFILEDIIICFTGDGNMHISDDQETFTVLDVFSCVHMYPEEISIRGPVIAIGFRGGMIHLYLVDSKEDWRRFDITKPVRTYNTGAEHINALTIGDDGGGPVIVIATEELHVTVLQFRKATKKKEFESE